LRLFSFGGYGLALAALALMVFGAIKCPPKNENYEISGEGLNRVIVSLVIIEFKPRFRQVFFPY